MKYFKTNKQTNKKSGGEGRRGEKEEEGRSAVGKVFGGLARHWILLPCQLHMFIISVCVGGGGGGASKPEARELALPLTVSTTSEPMSGTEPKPSRFGEFGDKIRSITPASV